MSNLQCLEEHRFVLRYRSLNEADPSFVFPCDAFGRVDMDLLTDRERADYFYARVVVGNALSSPTRVAAECSGRSS